MKKTLLLVVSSLFYYLCIAQNASVKGVITDTLNKQNLSNAVISLLRAKDSIMVKFTRSRSNGTFEIKNLKGGNYLLLVTYPQYADYVDRIILTDSSSGTNTGPIRLILKANLLEEVIVKQKLGSIRLKGDTTEFIADSFRVQPNATVEDLLRKLPGIQVDKNGKITAQGETVQKVLVDGEEFFGDDPTLVTQNLRADMVSSVQLYDKKSDQAAFTGIDDGQRQKTLNVKLKDGKKNGYFGKVNLSGGTDGYFDNQAMINVFKNKEKFAAYGILSNTGKTGLNWQETNSYGDNALSDADYDETNGWFSINSNSDDLDSWSGNYEGQGHPTVQTGGLHYNNKWNNDKQSINANYKILQLRVNGQTGSSSQTILHDTTYYNKEASGFNNQILRNRLTGTYEWQMDSSSSIRMMVNGGLDHKMSYSTDSSEERFTDSSLVNQSKRTTNTVGDGKIVNSSFLWRKKLKKKGRTLSFNLIESYTANNSTGYLNSAITTFLSGVPNNVLPTDQYKTYQSENTAFNSKLTYSEPLSKVSSLVFNYGIVLDDNNSQRSSYNKSSIGKYDQLDSIYSNNYRFNVLTQRGGIAYSLNKKKLRFNVGNDIGYTHFVQTDLRADTSIKRNFINWSPQANFNYQFTQQRRLSIRYNGSTRQPSIDEIQPVRVNDDPLNIVVGNPGLKPSFSNSISLNFSDYKVLSERNIWIGSSYNFTQNQVSSNSTIDTSGKTSTQYINLNGNHSFRTYLDYGFKLKKPDIRTGFDGSFNTSRNVNITNGLLNITKNNSYSGSLYLNKYKEKKYSLNLQASATYTSSISSLQSAVKTQYWTYELQPSFDIYLPFKFQVHTDGDYNFRQKTVVFPTNNNVFLLNAWVGRKFMKSEALLLKVSGNDILNQNVGFSRYANSNIITQNTYTTIKRFFLLSLVWNFTKTGVKAPGQ
jgi:hypothetical protein